MERMGMREVIFYKKNHTCGFSEAAFRTVSSTERIRQAASVAAVNELVLMRVGSHTKFANVSHALSFVISTPNHLWPAKR
jgi:hypothetical protein